MIIVLTLLVLCSGYYTFTYGVNLWREDKNRLGGIGTVFIAVLGTIVPIVVYYLST
ncbi:MAG: hypothetical protein N2484_15160 [Clostridia bacterium]|nr:hypothetical protein [Clostridia bacterium]